MNTKQIKLALTVGLLNEKPGNALQAVKQLMQGFRDEVGTLLSLKEVRNKAINADHYQQMYQLNFEHARLDIELISNPRTNLEVVQDFRLS